MTTLEEEPPMGDRLETRLPERVVAEQSTRLLGGVALEGRPQDLCDSVLHMAVETNVQTPEDFNSLLHTVLLGKVRSTNDRHPGVTRDTGIVKPERVQNALTDYYTVFPEALTPGETNEPSKIRQQHLATYLRIAEIHRRSHPEIDLLFRLEADLRDRAGNSVANAVLELGAAYGWATCPNYAEIGIDLYRITGKSQLRANKRPQQRH